MTLVALDKKYVTLIQGFIKEKRSEKEMQERFPNPILRDDIFKILDLYCTVVYYPHPKGEENNGFLLAGIPCGPGTENFVFIDSAQPTEKQIFIAAHELGHIWRLDEYIEAQTGEKLPEKLCEPVMSRFAAELLMPEDYFTTVFLRNIVDTESKKPKTSFSSTDLFTLLATLMNEFFVPYKSVVARLYEIDCISRKTALGLLELDDQDIFKALLRQIYRNSGYDNLLQPPTSRKYIHGLDALLDEAERSGRVPEVKIKYLREKFDLADKPTPPMMPNIPINPKKLK